MTRRHIAVEPVVDGVWAALVAPGGGAHGNAALVDLGGSALVFDTHMTVAAARELREAAEEQIGPVEVVANSHWHADHVRGNATFAGVLVVSTAVTRDLVTALGPPRLEAHKEYAAEHLDEIRGWLAKATKEADVAELSSELAVLETLDEIELRPPDRTFEEETYDLGQGRRAVRMETRGGAHTLSDGFVVVDDGAVVLAGDLVVIGFHPNLTSGVPGNWPNVLDAMEALDPDHVVPGHGPVGAKADLGVVRTYLEDLMELVDRTVAEGRPVEELEMPDRYEGLGFPAQFAANVAFIAERSAAE
jgi:glyoxylase-like metal-dependent hydrolase (beta-lactamase superfamily II)